MAYVPDAQATPPYVGAGSRMRFAITNATIGASLRVSVLAQPIKPPTTIAPPNDWLYDHSTGTWRYLVDGGLWAGSETGVVETANALLSHLKTGYGSQWSLSLLDLQNYDPAGLVWRRSSPFPTVTAVTGTFGTNPSGATDPLLGNVTTLILRTFLAPSDGHLGIGRLVLKLPAWELNGVAKRVRGISSTTGASGIVTANVTGLIGYLAGGATRIVGHNGGPADNIGNIGVDCSHRMMRALNLI